MVSKARDDLPEPESPVMTMSLSRGSSTSMFLRLCSRAPLTTILSISGPQHSAHAQWGGTSYHGRIREFEREIARGSVAVVPDGHVVEHSGAEREHADELGGAAVVDPVIDGAGDRAVVGLAVLHRGVGLRGWAALAADLAGRGADADEPFPAAHAVVGAGAARDEPEERAGEATSRQGPHATGTRDATPYSWGGWRARIWRASRSAAANEVGRARRLPAMSWATP